MKKPILFWRRFPHFRVCVLGLGGVGGSVRPTQRRLSQSSKGVVGAYFFVFWSPLPPPSPASYLPVRHEEGGTFGAKEEKKKPILFLTFVHIFIHFFSLPGFGYSPEGRYPTLESPPPSAVIPVSTCHQVHTGRRASGNQPAIGLDDPSTKS